MAKSEIKGAKRRADRLRRLKADNGLVTTSLYRAGQLIEKEAERSIKAGAISGPGHVPSAPGEPPNADTHVLDQSITTTVISQNPPTVHVTASAPYAGKLEWGTSNMVERPFMRPATNKYRAQIPEIVKEAIDIQVKRGS